MILAIYNLIERLGTFNFTNLIDLRIAFNGLLLPFIYPMFDFAILQISKIVLVKIQYYFNGHYFLRKIWPFFIEAMRILYLSSKMTFKIKN